MVAVIVVVVVVEVVVVVVIVIVVVMVVVAVSVLMVAEVVGHILTIFVFEISTLQTTTISMLTGLISPDIIWGADRGAVVYGHNIQSEMDQVRHSMGVCPQHDVLFEKLTVREHILFFAQLKGHMSYSTVCTVCIYLFAYTVSP
jgi:ABC-type Na+ transport system ATPase subunit NatA